MKKIEASPYQLFAFQGDLWKANIVFAVSMAHKFAPGDQEVEDAALTGLFEAAKRFRLNGNGRSDKQAQFLTYAFHWIKKYIFKRLNRPEEVSFEDLVGNTDRSLKEVLPCKWRVDRVVQKWELEEKVTDLLDDLKPIERKILRRRFYRDLSLRETAKELGLSHERVNQIEQAALKKLSNSPKGKELKLYNVSYTRPSALKGHGKTNPKED